MSCHKTVAHLGVTLDSCCGDTSDVDRVRKNYSVAKLGSFCTSDGAWMRIVDGKLFPVLVYGSHLWEIDRKATMRGIRRGLV